jgi:hypothetical protein
MLVSKSLADNNFEPKLPHSILQQANQSNSPFSTRVLVRGTASALTRRPICHITKSTG